MMRRKFWIPTGAALLMAFASASAMAGHGMGGMGGHGIGGTGGHGMGGSRMGGNFGAFNKPGPSHFNPGIAGQGNWNGGPGRNAHNGDRGHNGRWHRGRYFASYPYFYGGYYNDYAYDSGYGDCGWLYRRAIATGSPYWWRRYEACVY